MEGYENQAFLQDNLEACAQRTQDNTTGSASSEIRIVLVGKTGSGKSSAGNLILGQECFKTDNSPESVTEICEKREVQMNRYLISVFDTPGLFDTRMKTEKMKEEIVRCIEMSVPGPHVFLLIVRLDVRFTDEEKNTLKWIQENFGEEASGYTIILFTHADQLKKKTLKEFISKSNDLQALVLRCGGRFHSFNNEDVKNRSQVTKLMKKIEKMVENNEGDHYTSEIYKRAQTKMNKDQFWVKTPSIVILGKTGSGETQTRMTIVDQKPGKRMKIIDTPGLIDAPEEEMKGEMEKIVLMTDPGPVVFLLVIRLDERFTEKKKNTVKWIQQNFGEEASRYTIILFTHEDQLKGKPLVQHIRDTSGLRELTEAFRWRFHSFSNEVVTNLSQVTELMEKIEEMMEENEWRYYTSEMLLKAQRKKQFWSGKPRLVLLGETRSGKSSTGNTILGREIFKRRNPADFVTKTCKLHKAEVDEKKMKLIDTPGLSCVSKEIVKSVKKSAPGPLVCLLVIKLDETITDEEKNGVKWIQEKIGEEASRHTIILFTHTDHLNEPLEEFIRDNNDLQTLVDECGGRFHSFNNKDVKNRSQVTELMEKIEEMLKENEGDHYSGEIYQDDQRLILDRPNFWSGDLRILLLGKTGSGKTSVVETIAGRESFTKTCALQEGCVAEKSMTIIDTPGLNDAPDEKMKGEIEKVIKKSAPGPLVFLLVIRLDETFIAEEKRTVKWIQENFGEEASRHTIILFTHEDQLKEKTLEEFIRDRDYLQSLIRSCGGRFHSFNNEDRNNQNQVTELMEKIDKMAGKMEWDDQTTWNFSVKKEIHTLRTIALTAGPLGTAAIIAGGVVLGVTEVVAAPAVVVGLGIAAVGVAAVASGLAIYKRFA